MIENISFERKKLEREAAIQEGRHAVLPTEIINRYQ